MKFLYLHVFYLSIIAFLGYNYWSSVQAFKAFEQLDKQLNVDYQIMDNAAMVIHNTIAKNNSAYKTAYNARYYEHTMISVKAVDSLIAFIDANKNEFIKLNGGLDTAKQGSIINENSVKTSKIYFSNAKITQIKDKVAQLNKIFIDSIQNKWDKEKLQKAFLLPQLLAENDYLNTMKILPANAVLAKLAALKNQIKIDEIAYLNYVEDKTSPNYCGITTWYKTAITPKKSVLLEGETFEADIYLATYSLQNNGNIVIKVNGKPLEIIDGIAHFKGKNESIGTKTIKAEAIIRNPLTGAYTTSEAFFEYQVLPKCSRDCQ